MNIFEEALIYSTVMHTGAVRKGSNTPYIMHPMEVAQICATMTDDIEVMTAALLHDVVEDTDGTLKEIKARFGERVAELVASITENKYEGQDSKLTWKKRKEENVVMLQNSHDIAVKMLWLGDFLSNMRSLSHMYSEQGEDMWKGFNNSNADDQFWYNKTMAEILEIDLNRTGAFKELVKHINFIWPDTFKSEKEKYKKYKEISIDGCPLIGKGAKSEVYKYNDEVIVKVYNEDNTYKDIEYENQIARQCFVAGIPTAICFGIVKVGNRYGTMFEFLNSGSISKQLAKNPSQVTYYADMMADLALTIHSTTMEADNLPNYMNNVYDWVHTGLEYCEPDMASKVIALLDKLPKSTTLIHGDFHTGNVILQNDELLLIDMDRVSFCPPIIDLAGVFQFYVGNGELDPSEPEEFLKISYANQNKFYDEFMRRYLKTDDPKRLKEVEEKAQLLAYCRILRRVYKKGKNLSPDGIKERDYFVNKIKKLLETVDSLEF